jgi:tetratricopeptide (TPR) repeat protein
MTMRRDWLTILVTVFSLPSYAQFLPDLQARTPEEYDAYLDVLEGPVSERGPAFERAFPESALRLPVCEVLEHEWRSRGDVARAVAAAERGLVIAPDYLPLLVELADLLANGQDRLDRAESAAQRALGLLETAKAPRRIAADAWMAVLSHLRGEAHGALGLIRFKQDDVAGAIREFEAAVAEGSAVDPVLHYRLGRLYAITGHTADARYQLEQAAHSGDKTLRERAKTALAELR